MEFGEKDAKKLSLLVTVLILIVLSILVLWPFILAIVSGLFLAYIFYPVYRAIGKKIRNKSLVASLTSIIVVAIIFICLWFITPLLVRQFFYVYITLQKLDFQSIIRQLFPTASEQLSNQLTLTFNSALSNLFSSISTKLNSFVAEIPKFIVAFFVTGFVFFFALRDSERLYSFIKEISPINEVKRRVIVKNFKDMTTSIIYGWVVVGLLQGILAGIGLFIFGIDNALVLTVIAILFSIIPFLGPFFVYIPVAVYLFTQNNPLIAILFLLYNLIVVSTADNFLRSYIIARKTNIHSSVILIGMLGGLYAFGIIGLIVGPLILAYVLILIESFKDKSIYAIFS